MSKETINPPGLFNSLQFGFSQVTISKQGLMVFISGQVAWDEHMNIVGKNDLGTQARKAFANLKTAVGSVGGDLSDIVMLRIYIVDYNDEKGTVIGDSLRANFGTTSPPASTWINVKGLADSDFLLEIEAQAVI